MYNSIIKYMGDISVEQTTQEKGGLVINKL